MPMAGDERGGSEHARDDYEGVNVHSRKGIMAMRPVSRGSPFHFGMTMAFSGCVETCSASVSRLMTLERSRLR